MTREETLNAIAVMQAFADGKQLEVRTPGGCHYSESLVERPEGV